MCAGRSAYSSGFNCFVSISLFSHAAATRCPPNIVQYSPFTPLRSRRREFSDEHRAALSVSYRRVARTRAGTNVPFSGRFPPPVLLLSLGLRKARLELLDAACSVDGLGLARVKRVRGRGDFYLDERILLFVIPFVGFFGSDSRANKKTLARGDVFKNDLSIVCRMNILFHALPVRS